MNTSDPEMEFKLMKILEAAAASSTEETKTEERPAALSPKASFLDKLLKPKDKAAAETKEETKSEEAPKIEESPAAAATTEAPEAAGAAAATETKAEEPAAEAAAAETPAKEKRKSIFGFGKKKGDESKSDTEGDKSPTSPLPKFASFLSRKNSKSVKADEKEPAKEAAVPEAVAEESETKPEEKKEETAAAPATEEAQPVPAIGDVVADAVNVDKSSAPVQAAA